jgi:proteasome lid subunit RPN8/RPN11
MREKFLFSLEAIGVVLVECYRNGTATETGGVLVGPKGCKHVVTHALPSSQHADRQSAMYQQTSGDVAFLNQQLRPLQMQGYDYVGDFHRHPRGLTVLSEGDRNTCRNIFDDPDYVVDGELTMCIITEGSDCLPIFAYNVQPTENGVHVERFDIEIMPLHCIEHYLSFQGVNDHENKKAKISYHRHSNQQPATLTPVAYRP